MANSSTSPHDVLVSAPLSDRRQVCQRLQDLDVSCSCESDGQLWAAIETPLAAVQVWSVFLHNGNYSRREKIDWLNRCWEH
ncbi:Asr1405/Asl0597 family protein [Vacuolonema iberomarrocanum]|uniref:Asr1405/Asl0597 family protein n=1 Tax=Vacuolonema iberomarrocanum TaxID=3454632 RepID=UPI0019F10179|nr:hypothetical protein [filamentous cyanobacterium LEGE 07170]